MTLGARTRIQLHEYNTRKAISHYADVAIFSVAFAVLFYWAVELLMRAVT